MSTKPDPQKYNLQKATYTINEFLAVVGGVCRSSFYKDVQDGKIKITKKGKRSLIFAADGAEYLAIVQGER